MSYNPDLPCIVQSDFTILFETQQAASAQAREFLLAVAELVKSPAAIHTYRITPLSLWNAAAGGIEAKEIIEGLRRISKWDLPAKVVQQIQLWMSRYGSLRLEKEGALIKLLAADSNIVDELLSLKSAAPYLNNRIDEDSFSIKPEHRGVLKQELTRLGFPVLDAVGYHDGNGLPIRLKAATRKGMPFSLREYQQQAAKAFEGEGSAVYGGSGVIVLPCGAGKTVVGISVMERLQCETLILTSNVTSVRQWMAEILDKTTLHADEVGEYTGQSKTVRPVTIATYQILTHRKRKTDEFVHMQLFNERDWGLIIYDEVHLLPAPVFRATADIQATRRLGLTATLVREDGCEKDVFSLIGPKRFELPWKDLEHQGWIASVECGEIRIPLPTLYMEQYLRAEGRAKFRIAGENPAKIHVIRQLLEQYAGKPTLIIGQYLDQLAAIAGELNAPLMTGSTPQQQRGQMYEQFKRGEISLLVVSKIANFAVDLPDAAVAIQISGSYGSRQEEAQRLGRILRPKTGENTAYFFTIVSSETKEQEFAIKRQLFLIEQGYSYTIRTVEEDTAKEAAAR